MFAVIYKFKVKEGFEEKFQSSWEKMTYEFRDTHGALGSCLHKTLDNIFIAYARWPNKKAWQEEKTIINKPALAHMRECVEESFPAIPLDVVSDLLVKDIN